MTAHLWLGLIQDLKDQYALRHLPFELLLQLTTLPKGKLQSYLARVAAEQESGASAPVCA